MQNIVEYLVKKHQQNNNTLDKLPKTIKDFFPALKEFVSENGFKHIDKWYQNDNNEDHTFTYKESEDGLYTLDCIYKINDYTCNIGFRNYAHATNRKVKRNLYVYARMINPEGYGHSSLDIKLIPNQHPTFIDYNTCYKENKNELQNIVNRICMMITSKNMFEYIFNTCFNNDHEVKNEYWVAGINYTEIEKHK